MNCVIVCAFITGEQIKTMRQAIADLPERESEHMHLLFEQSLRDWNRSPQENDGRNKEARNALLLKWYPRPNKRNIHPIPDQNGKIYTLFQTRNAWKWYPLVRHIPIWLIYGSSPPPPPPLLGSMHGVVLRRDSNIMTEGRNISRTLTNSFPVSHSLVYIYMQRRKRTETVHQSGIYGSHWLTLKKKWYVTTRDFCRSIP